MREKPAIAVLFASLAVASVSAHQLARAESPAPTASGLPSEGKQDLSASTSQSGDYAQTDWNLFSTLEGAELVDSTGERSAKLVDVILDSTGRIDHLVVGTGIAALAMTQRRLDTRELPTPGAEGGLTLPLTSEQIGALPEIKDFKPETWSAAAIVGAEISDGSISIKDLRFAPGQVDRVILAAGNELFSSNRAHEVPFAELQISGSPNEPSVKLSEAGSKQLGMQ
ncbi:PRC-barrel domain-containing protein [Flaviflagellibacter deserti]|uniref:PRC-barrel domain-containing protein n=1 Tax=Flaviflagellibacter deserti TaxID=2267266 RepID=A0ABV9Z2A9_9HYPH